MLTVMLAMLGTAIQTPTVIWADAFEARERGVESAESRAYHVWTWANYATAAEITVGTETLIVAADPAATGFQWKRAGTVTLPQGRAGVTVSENVATIVLAVSDGYDPAKAASDMRVSDQPTAIGDGRAILDRDTNTLYSMTKFSDKASWEQFSEPLREKFLVACGLWPMPERTPLNAKITEVARHTDYIVEKVSFEAYPGFLVTGNLYRPVGDGPYPGVINPHGHWTNGRFEDTELCSVAGRCITFARMGMAAFTYDMVGYNDSRQFPKGWGHSGGNVSEDVRKREALWGIHPFAMQLWSAVRALDFMESLPYVDKDNLACTGASGGGTQTFALCAIDQRVKVSAPVNMISHSMQGGCPCENAPIIRLNASNMEIGALMAPRPMMMISATGDWTRATPTVEYPAIKGVYSLYDAADKVESVQIDAGHNYNKASREGVYRFFGKHVLGSDAFAEYTEPPFTLEPIDSLKVFPGEDPPAGYPNYEQLVASIIGSTRAKWNQSLPKDAASELDAFRSRSVPALKHAMGLVVPTAGTLNVRALGTENRGTYSITRIRVGNSGKKDAVPVLLYSPATKALKGTVVIAHGQGKAALADIENGGPGPLINALIANGRAVMTFDAFLTGEHHAAMKRTERLNKSFPDTFLPTDTAYRVQDVLTVLALARTSEYARGPVAVLGIGDAGLWSLFAAAVDGEVSHTLIDANQFDPNDDTAWAGKAYIPSIRSLGDVVTASALVSRQTLKLFNGEAWGDAVSVYATLAGKTADAVQVGGGVTPDAVITALQ
ncbi:MAG TPA: acetylxylan esterase [Candidatus Hydrogenedentes bacterium]|nr:acetylxylan esterase [Candidatus Hydrogenedentota bacterium]